MFNPVSPDRYLLPTAYLSVADIANPDLLTRGCWTWINLDIARLYEEQCQPSSGSAWPACPQKRVIREQEGRHNMHCSLPDRCDASTVCRLCRLEPRILSHQLFLLASFLALINFAFTCFSNVLFSDVGICSVKNLAAFS